MRTVNYLATEALFSDVLAAGINLDSLKNLVIKVLGTVLIIILLVRIMNAYAKRQWGEIVAEVIGVIVVGFFVWTPDTAIGLLQDITSSIFG
ncbi:hypothetical protein CLV47_11834 [Antricoccus suffuscus]|uniref:TrbC/VIRB2 family protein n=1 Tax=Antricoccus suffuscus TaxID=1629062 RepID=A0A2T0ZTI5_9ACTN|nr:TcpD family membrane protein [Antricoccus suffuscus]PRZ39670.1 hypothetical protein CLV47_11834 [Antricoccus suffuscus]